MVRLNLLTLKNNITNYKPKAIWFIKCLWVFLRFIYFIF